MRKLFGVFVLLLVLSLLKHMVLAGFAHPSADDFCYAWKSRGVSLWAWSVGEYHEWNGRYTSNLLMARGPLHGGTDFLLAYRTVPVVLLLLTLMAYRALVRAATEKRLRPLEEWGAAVVLSALFVNGMPALGEGFYWYTGAVTYQLANVLLLFLIASLLAFRQGRYFGGKWPHLALNAALVLVIAGMDEQHAVLLCAGFAAWCAVVALRREAAPWLLLALAVGAGLFVLAAPGNAVRGAFFPRSHALLPSVIMTARTTARVLVQFIASPALLACSVLYVPVHLQLRTRVPLLARGFGVRPVLVGVSLVAVVATCVFPAYWSMGQLAQERTLNVAYAFFLPLWSVGLAALLEQPWGKWLRERNWNGTVIVALCTLVLCAMQFTGNGREAWLDLVDGRAARYDAAMQARYRAFRSPEGMIVLQPLRNGPVTLAPFEEHHPDQHWMSECEARYFDVGEGRVKMTTADR